MFVAVMKVLMSSNGFVINSAIDGSIQMKPLAQFASAASNCTASVPESAFRSYLMGNPELKLALNEAVQVVFACWSRVATAEGHRGQEYGFGWQPRRFSSRRNVSAGYSTRAPC